LANRLDLTGNWLLRPSDLPLQAGTPAWVLDQQVGGLVTARGPWGQPQLQARFGQPNNPLLGRWDALLDWSDQRLVLQRFNSAHLRASGVLPLALRNGKGLVPGQLDLSLELERYPLERLELLVGAQLQGMLQASGRVRGPLNALTPDLDLRVDQPGAGPLSLRENWQGQWFGDPAGGGRLRMEALAPAPVGMLNARIDSRWVPRQVRLERAGGTLELNGRPRGYRWQANQLPLDGLQLALGPKFRRQPLQARLSGQGLLKLQPLAFSGSAQLDRPVFLGVWGKSAQANFRYANRRYSAQGAISPLAGGSLAIDWSGQWQGPFRARLQGERLPPLFLQQLVRAWPQWRGEGAPILGRASDIGTLLIDTFGGSVEGQLRALEAAASPDDRSRIWECSHIGGHRFAAVSLSLPTGEVHGRARAEDAPRLLAAAFAGEVVPELLRGRSSQPPPLQRACVHIRCEFAVRDADALEALVVIKDRAVPVEAHWQSDSDLVTTQVRHTDGRAWTVTVERSTLPHRPESCGAEPVGGFAWNVSSAVAIPNWR
jgi:translocation and assembly module TamB